MSDNGEQYEMQDLAASLPPTARGRREFESMRGYQSASSDEEAAYCDARTGGSDCDPDLSDVSDADQAVGVVTPYQHESDESDNVGDGNEGREYSVVQMPDGGLDPDEPPGIPHGRQRLGNDIRQHWTQGFGRVATVEVLRCCGCGGARNLCRYELK
jgi:hypothetical protein